MADKKPKKEIAQAYVRIYPIIEGLAQMMSKQIDGAQNAVQGKYKKMGQQIAQSLNNGLQMVNASGLTQTLSTGMAGAFKGITGSALNAFKSIGSSAVRVFGGAFRTAGRLLNNSLVDAAKTASVAVGGIVAAGLGLSVSKGFSRAMATTEARAKMKGLGYEGKNLDAIMKSASDAVDGLAYSTGDAATAASGLLASGVKPGEELTKILRTIGDTASLSGREFGDISSIFGKVFASGIIQGEEFNQLMDSGIPVLQYLSKSLNMSVKDVKKLASAGKISSAQFAKAMEENLGGVGERMASNSFSLSAKNVASQAGRIFEPIFTTALEAAIPVLGTIRKKLKGFVDYLKPVLAPIQTNIENAFKGANRVIENFDIGSAFTRVSTTIERFKELILPISGLLLGLSGSLLQSVPLIGGLFSGITGPVGLLAGFFAAVFANSENLRKSFGRLGTALSDLFKSIFNVQMGEFDIAGIFQTIGDGLASGVDTITGLITDKTGQVSGVLGKMWAGIINPQAVETLRTGAGKIFTAIGDVFSSIFAVMIEVVSDPRVRLAGAQIVDAFGSIFEAFSSLGQKNNIQSIASAIASTIAIAASIISTAIVLIADVIKVIVKITSTPAFSAFAAWLKGTAQLIVQSSGFLKVALVALGVAFAGFKVFSILSSVSAMLGKGPTGPAFGKKLADLVKGLGKGVAAAFKAIPGIAQAFVAAAPHLLAAIGVAALILLALGTLGHILKSLKVGEGLVKLGTVLGSLLEALMIILTTFVDGMVDMLTRNAPLVAEALGAIFTSLKPVLDFVLQVLTIAVVAIVSILRDVLLPVLQTLLTNFSSILSGVADVIMSLGLGIYVVLEGLASLIESILFGAVALFDGLARSVSSVVGSLLNGGMEAAAAALALAGGITALNAAMAGGTLMQGAANLGNSFLNVGKGVLDKINPANWGKDVATTEAPVSGVAQIVELVNALQSATDVVAALRTNWTLVAQEAITVGASIVSNLANGIISNQSFLNTSLASAINNMLASAQGQLDANPLQLRVSVPSELSASGVSSMNFKGQTSNTQNNNFNISNQNPAVVANAIENMMR